MVDFGFCNDKYNYKDLTFQENIGCSKTVDFAERLVFGFSTSHWRNLSTKA